MVDGKIEAKVADPQPRDDMDMNFPGVFNPRKYHLLRPRSTIRCDPLQSL